ncbi:MAG: GAF domain-containing protein [Chloroflexi bacterium]|nr:GAF domain-containing protein [Chloroflexota bacterium]
MNDQPQTSERPTHQQILQLGGQLVSCPAVSAQKTLIVETAARLVQGQADLWLAETLYRLPVSEESLSPTCAELPSDLMRRAIDAGQAVKGNTLTIAIPLLIPDAILGALEVKRPDGPDFVDDEIELLDGLVAQSVVGLQATRQVAIERWRVEQLSLVRQVSAQVADVFNLEELARRVTDLIFHTFKYYFISLFILEPDEGILHMPACAGLPDDGKLPIDLQVRLGEGIVGGAAQTGTEIVANDVGNEPRYCYLDALPETRSEVALPLKTKGRVLGVLDVQSDQTNAFDETNMLVLRALADNVAMAVERARLYGDLRRRADQLSTVADVSRAVASILDIDTLFDEVVRLIREQFGYPFVYLFTVAPGRGQIIYRAGTEPQAPGYESPIQPTCDLNDSEGIVPWVACHGKAVICNDIDTDPRCHPSKLPSGDTRAELAVPLIFGSQVLGVLNVRSEQQDVFGDQDRILFKALADSVATAIRNANLYRSERWRRQVADSLREVAGLLSSEMSLDQVLDAILVELERTLPCDVVAVWLLRNGDLYLSAVHGCSEEARVNVSSPDTDSWLGRALNAEQPIARTFQSPPDPLGATLGFSLEHSAVAAPLRAADQHLGVLTLAHRAPGRYGTEARMITSAFASYAAVAIENARLYQESQELARISTVMLQVAEATRSLATLDQVLQTVSHLVPTLVGVDRCAILLWDNATVAFTPAAAAGLTPVQWDDFKQWSVTPGEEPVFDDLRQSKAPIFIYDVTTDSRLSDLIVWDLGFESLLLLPLLAQDEVLGAMLIDYQSDWFEFETTGTGMVHDERLVIIQGIALQTAAAVENTKLREAQQEEAYVSAALLQVAQAVANLTNLDDVLSTIVRITPILVGVERCIIFLWDDEELFFRPAQAYGIPRDAQATLMAQRYTPGEFRLLDDVRERDSPMVYSPDNDAGNRIPADLADFLSLPTENLQENPRSLLAVPLSVKGDILGAMILEEAHVSHRSRERWLEIINGISHQAALAVQSDLLQQEMAERERLERELQLAHDIQQTFMPGQWLNLPGWNLAFTWRAARQVAGDFYDFFELPNQQLGLVIADVADKGMPAALFMALTRALVRAAALEETSPVAAMARVNDLLVPDAQSGMFVTAIYAVLSLETGELVYANAGHNLPLLLRSHSQELEQLKKGGMALGVLEGVRLKEHVVSLDPGDSLIFYTDGITEAFSVENQIYGEERLQATIQATNGSSAQTMLDAIDDSVDTFIGDAIPSDDRTIMILHRQ